MSNVKNFNINRVSLIFGGIPLDSGFGSDTVFSFESEDMYDDAVGADGEVIRWATNDRRFTLKVSLMQSSDKNALLSALVALGALSSNGDDVAALLLKDNNGSTVIASGKTWLKGLPGVDFGKSAKEREWTFRGVWDAIVVGGN